MCFSESIHPEVLRVLRSLRIIEGEKKRSQNKFKLDSRKDKQKIDLLFQEHAELEKNINLAQSQVFLILRNKFLDLNLAK